MKVYEYCGGLENDIHRLDRDKDGSVCESLGNVILSKIKL
ncbi:hypothetical protein GQ568_03125 [Patescibacteria group bacterium]|nr:hypothetical protein [Patescibacteria group bacterium]